MLSVIGLSTVVFSGCLGKEAAPVNDPDKIANMVEAGKSMYCTMSTTEGGTIETWTKGKKTKAYGKNMGGGASLGYMISDGEWTYMWSDGSTKGSKYPVEDEVTPRSEGEESEEFEGEMPEVNMKEELADSMVDDYKYDCKEQNIPDSTFVPPSEIEFRDVMKEMESGLGNFK